MPVPMILANPVTTAAVAIHDAAISCKSRLRRFIGRQRLLF
jgi:hypothetical protein